MRKEAAVGWQGERAQTGDADLSAMGVAGEDEVDVAPAAVGGDVDGVVGFVDHEDDGRVVLFGDGEREVGVDADVVETAEDDVLVFAFDPDELVDEDGQAVVLHVVADDAAADDDVMVSEDAVALGAGEGAEQGAATGGGFVGDLDRHRAAADEVAGDEQEVGFEGVDPGDDVADEEVFGVFDEVDVGELDDAETVEGGWEIGDVEGSLRNFDLVAADLVGVEGERSSCRNGT